jgi:hypothetical protein
MKFAKSLIAAAATLLLPARRWPTSLSASACL